MTIQDVFDRLRPISDAATALLRETGCLAGDGRLTYDVRPLPDRCEDAFFRSSAEEILSLLADMSWKLRYLDKPTHGEHTLRLLPDGRYGYPGSNGAVREFTCGERIEAKVHDGDGDRRWATATFEHDGDSYYLRGFRGMALDGLTVRERW